MLKAIKMELAELLATRIRRLYDLEIDVQLEIPPSRDLGDLAFPGALQLARQLKKPTREIGTEIADGLKRPPFVTTVQVAGPGFLNFYLDRSWCAAELTSATPLPAGEDGEKIIVEHTNINPNKAAHIGHLRNAVLGDILASVLRVLGRRVEVQNYIDDTGVQLADVVVGFLDLQGLNREQIEAIEEPFDYYCWDLYSEVGRWYEEDSDRQQLRRDTLYALESADGERAEIGRLVSQRVVSCHLATMRRLGVDYDLLTHESAILGLDFFARAFALLRESGAVRLEETGKNAGCWIMPLAESAEFAGLEDPDKVIVRSDGTVTYVGKDIAYQLWKFGLLGDDFGYRYWENEAIWESAIDGVTEHPPFGDAERVINVIDARQSYLQKIVRAGLERLGHGEEAERSIHFAYEMVSLSAAAAEQLGFATEDGRGMEMSGRKGIGVKADDLLDLLVGKSREEIAKRNREMEPEALDELARQIATAALRFFMAKATTNRVIAFDFDEALSFEGESGPYLLYSLVRAGNIRRKLRENDLADTVSDGEIRNLPAAAWGDDLWDLVYTVAQIEDRVGAVAESLEISSLARLALDLAQRFNAIYHRHPILQEQDPELRHVRLAATQVFTSGLRALCELLGLPQPSRM